MAHIDELMQEISLEQEAFISSSEYKTALENIRAGKLIESLKEHPGWKLLQVRLKGHLEILKHDLLFAEEAEDPVTAKIQRQEKRAFAKAVLLLADHVDMIFRVSRESTEVLQERNIRPEMDDE